MDNLFQFLMDVYCTHLHVYNTYVNVLKTSLRELRDFKYDIFSKLYCIKKW